MKNLNLKVQYIDHSGFTVETSSKYLIFDYYRGPVDFHYAKKDKNAEPNTRFNTENKNIYVFSSHAHADHFNPAIFEWQKDHPGIQYLLSYDIQKEKTLPSNQGNITFFAPYEEKPIDDLYVKAYNSTDEGVSFLVACDGIRIFHAGDLNWWYWWGDTPEGIEKATKDFKAEIAKIKGESIDLAFFPVDPRLEQYYRIGGEYFIQEIQPRIFVPMHFGDGYSFIQKFKSIIEAKGSSTQVIELTHRGQVITL